MWGAAEPPPQHTRPRASVSPCVGAGLTPTRGLPSQTLSGAGSPHPCGRAAACPVCPPVSPPCPPVFPPCPVPPSARLIPRRLFAQQSAAATDSCRGRGGGTRGAAHACARTRGHRGTPSRGTRVCRGAGVAVPPCVHRHPRGPAVVCALTRIPVLARTRGGANARARPGAGTAQSVQMRVHGRVSARARPRDGPRVWRCTPVSRCNRVHSPVPPCAPVPVSVRARCGANPQAHASACPFPRVAAGTRVTEHTCPRASAHVEQCRRVCTHFPCRCTRVCTPRLPGTRPRAAHASPGAGGPGSAGAGRCRNAESVMSSSRSLFPVTPPHSHAPPPLSPPPG